MPSVLYRGLHTDEAEIGFVDQCRGLQGGVRGAAQVSLGDAMEFFVDMSRELVETGGVTLLPLVQHPRHFAGCDFVPSWNVIMPMFVAEGRDHGAGRISPKLSRGGLFLLWRMRLCGRKEIQHENRLYQSIAASIVAFAGHQSSSLAGGDAFPQPQRRRKRDAAAHRQSSLDSSAVWARSVASVSDPMVVEPGSIPWQLLQVVGMRPPAHGGTGLEQTTFIQRVNTSGGVAPAAGDVGHGSHGVRAVHHGLPVL